MERSDLISAKLQQELFRRIEIIERESQDNPKVAAAAAEMWDLIWDANVELNR